LIKAGTAAVSGRVCGRRTVLLAGVLSIVSACVSTGCSREDATASAQYPLVRNIALTFPFSNTTGRRLAGAEVRVHGIVAQSSNQWLRKSEAPGEHKQFVDEDYNQTWIYSLADVGRTATPQFAIDVEVGVTDELIERPEADVERYLATRGSEKIQGIARDFGDGDSDDAALAGLLAWFSAWSKGGQSSGEISATSAATDEKTDEFADEPAAAETSDLPPPAAPVIVALDEALERLLVDGPGSAVANAFLFTELARATGIPTRISIGLHPAVAGTHTFRDVTAWPEVYVGRRWTPIDMQQSIIAPSASDYVAMRILDAGADTIQYEASGYLVETVGVYFSPGAARITVRNPKS